MLPGHKGLAHQETSAGFCSNVLCNARQRHDFGAYPRLCDKLDRYLPVISTRLEFTTEHKAETREVSSCNSNYPNVFHILFEYETLRNIIVTSIGDTISR